MQFLRKKTQKQNKSRDIDKQNTNKHRAQK